MSSALQEMPYYLGAPMWANTHWRGSLFEKNARPSVFLQQYARQLNSVEGNNTFYGIVPKHQFEIWASMVPSSFRFCFKFPREITHELGLSHVMAQKKGAQFLTAVESILPQIGLLILQLPPDFSRHQLASLEKFIKGLPDIFTYGVEVRHPDFFTKEGVINRFNSILQEANINRVHFHTEVLHGASPESESIKNAQARKPHNPSRFDVTAHHPVVRFVGHNQASKNEACWNGLINQTADWILQERKPYIFIHSPDDKEVPQMCRLFHEQLKNMLGDSFPALPLSPAEIEAIRPQQQELF